MNTPPEPTPPPKHQSFAEHVAQIEIEDSHDICGRFEPDLLRRLVEHGGHVDTLPKLLRFCRERFPQWYIWADCFRSLELDELPPSGQEYCRGLWSGFLYTREVLNR